MSRRVVTAREQYEMFAPWHTAAGIAEDDPLWALLDPAWGGKHKPYVPPPRAPESPPDPDRYYKHLTEQEDRTHTAHAWLPIDVVDHYREYDRDTRNPDYQAVKRVVGEQGVKLPLWISANDTHGLLVEGNNRLQAAKELGIPSLPVRFTYNDPPMSNEGNSPVPHHSVVKDWLARNRHKLAKHHSVAMEDNVVTVYSKPNCPQCDLTKKHLTRKGIPHEVRDVTTDPEAHAFVTGLGYLAAPVVHAGPDNHWSGFRPDRINGLLG